VNKKTIREAAAEMGRKGGLIGGKRSLETMTPESRVERAKKASEAAAKARTAAAKKRKATAKKKAAKE
jgi:hypothetical protein